MFRIIGVSSTNLKFGATCVILGKHKFFQEYFFFNYSQLIGN